MRERERQAALLQDVAGVIPPPVADAYISAPFPSLSAPSLPSFPNAPLIITVTTLPFTSAASPVPGVPRRNGCQYDACHAPACSRSPWHFLLTYPASIGFSDDDQSQGSCGGVTPDFATGNFTDLHIGGDSISTRTTHPQGNWLYRITLDPKAAGNWTQVFPIVQQTGRGEFCEPLMTIPSQFIGQKGVLGVVSRTPDGLLYQGSKSALVQH